MNENSYHITIGTYGARLHGGEAPTVERSRNKPGDPFVPTDPVREYSERKRMTEAPCLFTEEQRRFVEEIVPKLCEQGKWIYHIVACQPDHVHLLVSSHVDPKEIRRWLKTWLTQALNEKFGRRKWFVRDGSTKWVKDEQYFNTVVEYIRRQRISAFTERSSLEERNSLGENNSHKKSELRAVLADNQSVPQEKTERERIRAAVEALPPEGAMTRKRLEELARKIVDEEFSAWTMVLIGSRFWRDRVRAVPFERRLLLLPHCMRNSRTCPAKYDADGLLCENCGGCPLGALKAEAETLGYHVMIAEGSPIVMQWILGGRADAILGLGCLRSLERAFEKLQLAGIPALAVPLHASECRDSVTDLDWVYEMIRTPWERRSTDLTEDEPTWIHLLRGAAKLFENESVEPPDDPADTTRRLGAEFLVRGGKYYRPFITLAVYDALTGSSGTRPDGAERVAQFPDWIKDAARAVEIFHKASLIHDDIEDDDSFRYGMPTLHRMHGIPAAINVGDYLLGLGYGTVAELRNRIPPSKRTSPGEIVAEMLGKLAEAHTRLSEGQGAELDWKTRDMKSLTPMDVLRIYVLKTSPAFEAAMSVGVLAAVATGSVDRRFYRRSENALARFSRHLGVAFQIKNDLDDWTPDRTNKQVAGQDALHGRPTIFRAFSGREIDFDELSVREIERRLRETGVFDKARLLVEKYADKARETTEQIDHLPFRRLLLHFVETIASL